MLTFAYKCRVIIVCEKHLTSSPRPRPPSRGLERSGNSFSSPPPLPKRSTEEREREKERKKAFKFHLSPASPGGKRIASSMPPAPAAAPPAPPALPPGQTRRLRRGRFVEKSSENCPPCDTISNSRWRTDFPKDGFVNRTCTANIWNGESISRCPLQFPLNSVSILRLSQRERRPPRSAAAAVS